MTAKNIAFGLLVSAALLSLQSCEAFIKARGTVCDKETNLPVAGIKVQLLWHNNRDTMYNSGFVVDTLSFDKRKQARKHRVKDEYASFDHGNVRWALPVPLFTDTLGRFQTRTTLVSAVFGVPKVSVLFTKDGYKTLVVNHKERYSKLFYLEKAD